MHVEAWRQAYAHVLPPEYLAGLDISARAERWRAMLADGAQALVAVSADEGDSRVIGFATAGAGRDDDAPRELELQAIYILSSAYGSGAGQQLLDAAIADRPAFLWMADDNPRAEAFYRRNGFERDGTTKPYPIGPAVHRGRPPRPLNSALVGGVGSRLVGRLGFGA